MDRHISNLLNTPTQVEKSIRMFSIKDCHFRAFAFDGEILVIEIDISVAAARVGAGLEHNGVAVRHILHGGPEVGEGGRVAPLIAVAAVHRHIPDRAAEEGHHRDIIRITAGLSRAVNGLHTEVVGGAVLKA